MIHSLKNTGFSEGIPYIWIILAICLHLSLAGDTDILRLLHYYCFHGSKWFFLKCDPLTNISIT